MKKSELRQIIKEEITKILKEESLNQKEIDYIKKILKKHYNDLIKFYIELGYDEKELKTFYNYIIDPSSINDLGKLETWKEILTIDHLFNERHFIPNEYNIIRKVSPVNYLRKKNKSAYDNDEFNLIKNKKDLIYILNKILSGDLKGKDANIAVGKFSFSNGSLGITNENELYLRLFGLGGGDFNNYYLGIFKDGKFLLDSPPRNKTALKIHNFLKSLFK